MIQMAGMHQAPMSHKAGSKVFVLLGNRLVKQTQVRRSISAAPGHQAVGPCHKVSSLHVVTLAALWFASELYG
jgi:hypothetical protein